MLARLRFTSIFWFIYTIFVKWLTRLINGVCGRRWPRRCSTDRYPNTIGDVLPVYKGRRSSRNSVVKSRKQFYENHHLADSCVTPDRRVIRVIRYARSSRVIRAIILDLSANTENSSRLGKWEREHTMEKFKWQTNGSLAGAECANRKYREGFYWKRWLP